ncbi:MAG: hypothetical protein D6762_08365 [Candidatus Neomarinimicrobiota bacterium]|nr:MAG: hypothetical protein D6762_08365 [Candidatus Neomarinimicrobiota bacterium]
MKEQLDIIQSMIEMTRQRVARSGKFFIFWGWWILFALLGQYGLVLTENTRWIWIWWLGISVTGGLYTGWRARRMIHDAGLRTKVDSYIITLWQGCAILILLLAFVALPLGTISIRALNPLLMLILGLGVLMTGIFLDWRGLKQAGLLWWLAGVIAMFLPWEIHGLIMAATLIPGYLVPGYVLERKFRHA